MLEVGIEILDVYIEENIGISKDYNIFEFINVIVVRDMFKVF